MVTGPQPSFSIQHDVSAEALMTGRTDMRHRHRTGRDKALAWCVWVAVLMVVCAAVGGCTYRRVVKDGWAPLRELADKKPGDANSRDTAAERSETLWAVQLAAFTGPMRHGDAIAMIRALRERTDLSDLWVQEGGQVMYLYQGRFNSREDRSAQDALQAARSNDVGGSRPFAAAELVPVTMSQKDAPTEDPLDLRRFRGMYTLQIGYYDDAFGPGFREAAVQAARALRDDGHEAYFYHGPHRSLITVGLFSDGDFVQRGVQRTYGPAIREVQETFPNNLGNGVTLVEKVDGRDIGNQPSFLVRVF